MRNLSGGQVQNIFSGRIVSWSSIPGSTRGSNGIVRYIRTAASGTADAFQNIFLGPSLRVARSAEEPTSGRLASAVHSDKNGVGYVSFDFTRGLNAPAYQGVACTVRNAKSGQYGGVRSFWLVSRGRIGGGIQDVRQLDPHVGHGEADHGDQLGSAALVQAAAPATGAIPPASRRRNFWTDRRVEPLLGALACLVLAIVVGMIVFVFLKAWPSFSHNGLGWFGSGGDVDAQIHDIYKSSGGKADYHIHAWPLIYATALTTFIAVAFGLAFALLCAIFIVEFAPNALRRLLEPVVRLLAAVPSVIYGLIGILVFVPFVNDHLISEAQKKSVLYVVQLNGASLLVAVVILTVMITPIMIAIIVDALRSVPSSWKEGAAALGVNRWRVMWTIVVRAARPAIIAAVVLATARALGEAIMLSMVSGSIGFAPNPLDGITFLFEPLRPLAATIVDNSAGLFNKTLGQTLYAFAALLLVSSAFLSSAGWAAKRPLRKYGVRP